MGDSAFPYPGGKSNYAEWIISHIPEHECFVEVFGGAGGVILNKSPSQIDVYNDINNDLAIFFRVLRNQTEELVQFLERLPYSRDEYERIAEQWYGENHRPNDDIQRAGWFYFLRQSTFSGKLSKAGFSVSSRPDDNRARAYHNGVKQLDNFSKRFQDVIIESQDYRDVVNRYDKNTTAFYFDPPYLEVGDGYYGHDVDFDHGDFVERLQDIKGNWIVSYNDLPNGLSEYTVATRETRYTMSSEQHTYNTERLVMNFDPAEVEMFRPTNQQGLSDFA